MSVAVRFTRGEAPVAAGLGDMGQDGAVGLIEWSSTSELVDAEVPEPVRAAIARALVRVGAVTFLVSEPGSSMTMAKVKQGLARKLLGRKLLQGTTSDAAAVEMVFDDPLQAWWLGSAVAVISRADQVAPMLDADTWQSLAGDRWTSVAARLEAIEGVLRSGVDGEMAGWWSRGESLRDRFEKALREEAAVASAA